MRILRWILLALYLALLGGLLATAFGTSADGGRFLMVLVGITIASIVIFLKGAGLRDVCEPVHSRRLLIPAIAAGFMFAVLMLAFSLAMFELCFGEAESDYWAWLFWIVLLGSWIGWSVLLYVYVRGRSRWIVIRRIAVLAFGGSFAELLATIPAHIIVSRRPGCLVGMGTLMGIVGGVMLMIWSFGPGIALLFMHDRYAWRKQGRCVKCGYDLQGITSERCPECGFITKHHAGSTDAAPASPPPDETAVSPD